MIGEAPGNGRSGARTGDGGARAGRADADPAARALAAPAFAARPAPARETRMEVSLGSTIIASGIVKKPGRSR